MKVVQTTAICDRCVNSGPGRRGGDLSRANVIDVPIELGSNDDGMYFKPDNAMIVTDQAYNLMPDKCGRNQTRSFSQRDDRTDFHPQGRSRKFQR